MGGREKFKNFIKNPGKWLWAFWAAFAVFVVAAILVAVLWNGANPAAYALYAVILTLGIYCICVSVRPARAALSRMVASNRVLSRMSADYGYRTVAFSVVSLAINMAYAIYQGVLGAVFRSAWYTLFAGYYFVLGILRAVVIFRTRRADGAADDIKIYLVCGCMFIVLSSALAALVTYLIYSGNQAHHGLIGAISMAAYTFYKIITAAINIVKNRKYGSFALQSLRNINFADALLSVFALQVTMIAAVGGGGEDMAYLNMAMGAAVVLITIVMGIYMIVRSARGLRTLKKSAAPRASAPGEDSNEQ